MTTFEKIGIIILTIVAAILIYIKVDSYYHIKNKPIRLSAPQEEVGLVTCNIPHRLKTTIESSRFKICLYPNGNNPIQDDLLFISLNTFKNYEDIKWDITGLRGNGESICFFTDNSETAQKIISDKYKLCKYITNE